MVTRFRRHRLRGGMRWRRRCRRAGIFWQRCVRYATSALARSCLPKPIELTPLGARRPLAIARSMQLATPTFRALATSGIDRSTRPTEHRHRVAARTPTKLAVHRTLSLLERLDTRATKRHSRSDAHGFECAPRRLGCCYTRAFIFSEAEIYCVTPGLAMTNGIAHQKVDSSD